MSGVDRCSSNIRACHREDQWAHEMLDAVERRHGGKGIASNVTPNGPGRVEAKGAWSATEGGKRVGLAAVKSLARHVGVKAATELAKKVASGVSKALVQQAATSAANAGGRTVSGIALVGLIKTGVELASEAHHGAVSDARAQGQRESDGLHRDAMRAFIVAHSGDAFTPEFRAYLLRDTHEASKRLVGKMATEARVSRGAEGYEAEKAVVQNMAKDGIAQAKARGITDSAALARALKEDASFREKYETSTAFRLGVASHVYETWRAAQR